MGYPELILRVTIAFAVAFIATRVMGRKEISQMTFFNFVSAMALGSITASLAVNSNLKISYGIIALALWGIYTVVMGLIDINSKKSRKVVEGEPLVVVKSGKVMENSLKKTRLSMDSLNAMLRQKNVFSMADVEFAILENNGQLSVMKKQNKPTAAKSNTNTQQEKNKLDPSTTSIVTDGIIDQENLSKLNLTKEWLDQQLKQSGVNDLSEVFFAEYQQDGTLYIDKRNDTV